jgi:hypothetical protein
MTETIEKATTPFENLIDEIAEKVLDEAGCIIRIGPKTFECLDDLSDSDERGLVYLVGDAVTLPGTEALIIDVDDDNDRGYTIAWHVQDTPEQSPYGDGCVILLSEQGWEAPSAQNCLDNATPGK